MNSIIRNEIFMENQDMIWRIIRRNRPLIYALRLEPEDVYQELAIAALKAIDSFDPTRSDCIQAHIWMQMQYAVLEMKQLQKPHGMTAVGKRPRPVMCSLDSEEADQPHAKQPEDPEYISPQLRRALSRLDESERAAVIRYLEDQRPQKSAVFRSALDKLRCYYLTVMPEYGVVLRAGEA